MSSIDWTTTVRCCNCFDDMDSWLVRGQIASSEFCLQSTQMTIVRCSSVCQSHVLIQRQQSDGAIALMPAIEVSFLSIQNFVSVDNRKPILNRLNGDSPMLLCFNDSNDNYPMLFCVQKFHLQSIQMTIVRCSSMCRSSVLNRLKGQWSVALLCANAVSWFNDNSLMVQLLRCRQLR